MRCQVLFREEPFDFFREFDYQEYEQTASQCRCDSKPKSKEIEASFDKLAELTEESGSLDLNLKYPDFELSGGRTIDKLPTGPFGTLTISQPSQFRFTYVFTPDDLLWIARFIVGEAGGRNNLDNQAVIWAMFNRFAFFTHRYYKTFHNFIRAYSTPLQPILRSWGAAKRHMNKPDFVRTGGFYKPPYDNIPKGQLRNFLKLQQTVWEKLPSEARALAFQAVTGRIPNPIGNASEFGSTHVYFRDRYGRNPSDQEWLRFTQAYAQNKRWYWIGIVDGLNQKKNTFFIQARVANLANNTVRIIPQAGAVERESDRYELGEESTEWFDEYEDDCPDCPEVEEEFNLSVFPKPIVEALRDGKEKEAVKLAFQRGFSREDITDLVFFWRHSERRDTSGMGRPISKGDPQFKQLQKEWLDIRSRLVEPAISQQGGPNPEVNTLMPKDRPGFFCRKPDSRRWGLPETIIALTLIAQRWFFAHPKGPRIVISDISKRGGGDIDPHKSHKKGLDIDIGLMRNDNKESGTACSESHYSRTLTKELIDLIINNGILPVKTIGFCDRGISDPKLSRWSGHHNHLHVRFCLPTYYKALQQPIPKQPDYHC
ncbi:hypothetical protein METHB2_530028 [Candidatus Methylobacter favarea]|uniref:Penicillin-insensitive murein endopeptidase n=1 Tax=Candidatus Methylobacter favarea TaxID=2707345 RepID=A0A8S0XHL9_9GAMM|nr:penicillin-insensitive murein endopeptidase [Candidatus Methylobacter favarea]CAA9891953.1 hypothetical protein METHB2_530028 [Candidatus Methylobacter favarea]